MTAPTMQFTVPAAAEAVAAAIGDREFIIQGDRRYTYAADRRAVQPARGLPALARTGLPHRTRRAGRSRGRARTCSGIYAYNGNEYLEAMLGRLPRPGRPLQRQLPLRRGTNWSTCSPTPVRPPWSTTPSSRRASPTSAPAAAACGCSSRSPTTPATTCLHGAVDYESIVARALRSRRRSSRRPTTSTCSTPAAPPACPRACCGDSTTSSCPRWAAGPSAPTSRHRPTTRSPSAPRSRAPCCFDAAAVHARRRAVGRHDRTHHGQTVVFPDDTEQLRRRRRGARRSSGSRCLTVHGRRRRDGPAAADEHRTRHRGPVVAGRGRQRRRAPDPDRQAAPHRRQTRPDRDGRRRIVGDRHPDEPHVDAGRGVDRQRSTPGPDTIVAAEDLDSILEPGHEGMGWLAQRGYVPLGYMGDAEKTAKTFPVIDGVRYSIPGDRARHLDDGRSNCSAATR